MTPRTRPPRSRANRRRIGLLQLVIALFLVSSIGAGALLARNVQQNANGTPPAAVGRAARGGEYIEGAVGFPSTLNPLLATSQSERDLGTLLFRGLTQVDGSGLAQPDLAEEWSVSDDGLTYHFRLRPDIKWHDGTPVTSQDVRFTAALVQDPDFPGDGALARFWRGVVVDTPEPNDVIFHLLDPFAAFPNYASLPIVPKHVLGGVLSRDLPSADFNRSPVGTGPYRVEQWDDAGSTISLVPFDGFDGTQPHLVRIQFRYFPDSDALLTAVVKGSVDGTGAVAAGALLRPGALPRTQTVYAPIMSSFTALFFNLQSPLFSNVESRRAVSLGFDQVGILENVLQGQAVIGTGPLPRSSWAYTERSVQFDQERAMEMLANAGWQDTDDDGVLENGSTRFSFPLLVNADDPQRMAVASEIAQQLSRIKVQVQVRPLSTAEVSQALASRQFTAAVFGWHSASGDPDCYQLWHSSQVEDGLNFTGLRDPEIDRLLEEARSTSDQERRKSLYAAFQARFADEVPAVVLYYPRYYFTMDVGIHGVRAEPVINPSDRLRMIVDWYTETESQRAEATP